MPKTTAAVAQVLAAYRALSATEQQHVRSAIAEEADAWASMAVAGKLLGRNRSSVWRAVRAGRLVTNGKPGRELRIAIASVVAMAERSTPRMREVVRIEKRIVERIVEVPAPSKRRAKARPTKPPTIDFDDETGQGRLSF